MCQLLNRGWSVPKNGRHHSASLVALFWWSFNPVCSAQVIPGYFIHFKPAFLQDPLNISVPPVLMSESPVQRDERVHPPTTPGLSMFRRRIIQYSIQPIVIRPPMFKEDYLSPILLAKRLKVLQESDWRVVGAQTHWLDYSVISLTSRWGYRLFGTLEDKPGILIFRVSFYVSHD